MLQPVFSFIKYFSRGVRSLPVRKARLSSSVHFVSTKRGGRTRPSASRTAAQTPLEPNASERRGGGGETSPDHQQHLKMKYFLIHIKFLCEQSGELCRTNLERWPILNGPDGTEASACWKVLTCFSFNKLITTDCVSLTSGYSRRQRSQEQIHKVDQML